MCFTRPCAIPAWLGKDCFAFRLSSWFLSQFTLQPSSMVISFGQGGTGYTIRPWQYLSGPSLTPGNVWKLREETQGQTQNMLEGDPIWPRNTSGENLDLGREKNIWGIMFSSVYLQLNSPAGVVKIIDKQLAVDLLNQILLLLHCWYNSKNQAEKARQKDSGVKTNAILIMQNKWKLEKSYTRAQTQRRYIDQIKRLKLQLNKI